MSISTDVIVVVMVLLAACLHAGWNTLVKTSENGLLAMVLFKVPTMVISAIMLAIVGLPSLASVPYAIGSAMTFMVYSLLLVRAYRLGDFNFIYPVARGSAPLCVAVLAVLLIDEQLTPQGLAGIMVICGGISVLAYHPDAMTRHIPDLARAGGVGICIAIYTLLDGTGVRISGNVLGYTAMISIFSGITLIIAVLFQKPQGMVDFLRREWKTGLLGGLMMFMAYAIVLYALTLTQIAHVAALRETGVIFAALIGALVLREPLGLKRILAAIIVTGGIIMVSVSV